MLALAKLRDQMGRRDEAKALYAKAIQGNSTGSADAFKRLGRIFYDEADIYSAIEAYERATKLVAQDVEVWNRLGNAYLDVAALSHATRCFSAALQLRPDYAEVYDNLLLCYHYNPKISATQMFEAHREWARRFSRPRVQGGSRSAPQSQANRARIGFVWHSMCRGATGNFLLPLLRHIDASSHEIFCYSAGTTSDEMQRQLQVLTGNWRDVSRDGDDELAQKIRADGIEILIDLDGHTPGNRLRAVALKPAPIIVTWLDYFNTTGLDAVDFLIGDTLSTPTDGAQLFTEQIMRIEPSRLCYAPPDYAPHPAPPPILQNGYVTFGSFNRLSKLAEPVVDQWARLLKMVPDSRLLLKNAAFKHPNTRRVFSQRFELRGIAAHRLELRSSSPHSEIDRVRGCRYRA
jgi:predicted O-linked N-acetylglucosamine transferase (SPINDLY family)